MSSDAYVGIDPSYSAFAVVVLSGSASVEEVEFNFTPARTGRGAARLLTIHSCLEDYFAGVVERYGVRQICLEGYAPGKKFGREVLGELGGVTRLALARAFPVEIIHTPTPTTLKKFVVGSGGADKSDMKLAVYKRWGAEYRSHDLADAYGLARIAEALDRDEDELPKFQREVIRVLHGGAGI